MDPGVQRLTFTDLAAASWDLVCEVDATGQFIYVNDSWERILGWPASDLLGRNYSDFLHADDVDETRAAQALAERGAVRDFFNRYRHRDGRYVWMEWRGGPWAHHQVGVARPMPNPPADPTTGTPRVGAMALLLGSQIDSGAIQVWFQPIVEIPNRRVCGFEALLRRVGSGQSGEPAAQWLPIVESLGLMGLLTPTVIKQAISFLSACPENIWVSMNASAQELSREDFYQCVDDQLAVSNVDPRRLGIEISEHLPVLADKRVVETLNRCADQGIRLLMDDFGTSYAALAHLRDYPVAGLKLDRSFVSSLPDERATALAIGVTRLAKQLGLEGIAEGVETAEQERALLKCGWNSAQGWLYGQARPADEQLHSLSC
jgi:PAS domain S-box-containing protein